jgi:hypothetical protein
MPIVEYASQKHTFGRRLSICIRQHHAGYLAGDRGDWEYEGPKGATHWGELDPAYAICNVTPARLALSYDLVCTTLYQAHDVLALALGDSKSFPDRKRLTAFVHAACGLSRARTLEVLDRVLSGVKLGINDVRRYSKAHPSFAAAGARLIATFEDGAASIAE